MIKLGVTYSRLKAENKELKNRVDSQENDIDEIKNDIKKLDDYRFTSSKLVTEVSTKLENIAENMNKQFNDMKDMIKEMGVKR